MNRYESRSAAFSYLPYPLPFPHHGNDEAFSTFAVFTLASAFNPVSRCVDERKLIVFLGCPTPFEISCLHFYTFHCVETEID